MADPTEERRLLVASFAPTVGSLAALAITAGTARAVDSPVLCVVVLVVAAASVAGGRLAALPVAITAALGFDFFHVEPVLVLHGGTALALVAGLGAVAVVAGAANRYN